MDAANARGETALHQLVTSWRDSKMLNSGKMDGATER